jgi:hypothetical protein
MAARLWTALLLLAAVFALHGLQCTADAHASGAARTTSVVAPAAPPAVDSHVGASAAADDPAAVSDGRHGSPLHGSAGHLWTLCLAVLAAGIAVLLALLVPRLVGLVSPALRRVRTRTVGWLAPLRPPDLSALCLLRI